MTGSMTVPCAVMNQWSSQHEQACGDVLSFQGYFAGYVATLLCLRTGLSLNIKVYLTVLQLPFGDTRDPWEFSKIGAPSFYPLNNTKKLFSLKSMGAPLSISKGWAPWELSKTQLTSITLLLSVMLMSCNLTSSFCLLCLSIRGQSLFSKRALSLSKKDIVKNIFWGFYLQTPYFPRGHGPSEILQARNAPTCKPIAELGVYKVFLNSIIS